MAVDAFVVDLFCGGGGLTHGLDKARLEVVTKNGENFTTSIEHATGSSENPMSDDQLEEKFTMLTEFVLGTYQAQKLMQMCWEVEQIDLATLLTATDSN